MKISGIQVSPVEIEDVILSHPEKLIIDVTVAGVSGGRTSDEKVPRAWIVLSAAGRKKGPAAVIKALDEWEKENLSKYKWTRGGIEIVKEVCCFYLCIFNNRTCSQNIHRSLSLRLERRFAGFWSINMSGSSRRLRASYRSSICISLD